MIKYLIFYFGCPKRQTFLSVTFLACYYYSSYVFLHSHIHHTVALDALRAAGFEIIEYKDLAQVDDINPVPWYQPLVPAWSLSGFRLTTIGKMTTHYFVNALEKIGMCIPSSFLLSRLLSVLFLLFVEWAVPAFACDPFLVAYFFLFVMPRYCPCWFPQDPQLLVGCC